MRLTIALVLLSLGCPGVAAQAAEPELFARFKTICLDTAGDRTKVAAAVARWGVADIPAPMQTLVGGPFTDPLIRSLSVGDDEYLLAAGSRISAGRNLAVCTVSGPGPASTLTAAQAWLGDQVKPRGAVVDGSAVFVWLDTPAGRRSPKPDELPDPKAAVSNLVIARMGDDVVLSIVRPK